MVEASDSVILRYLLQGDGLVVAKIRAMRAEILGLDKSVLKANEAQVASAAASSKAATGFMRFGSAAKWTTGIFGVGLAFSLVGVLRQSVKFMDEQNVVMKQSEAQLISTGHAAGFNAEQLKQMSESMAAKTGQDPLRLQEAENRMLSFSNVRDATFTRAIRDANDLSVAMRMGPEAAAKALGFALNNPATGMMRLTRIGVSLSQANKQYIKDLVARGQTDRAQLFILTQLEHAYGGSALHYGTTLPGALGKLRYAIDELLSRGMHPLITSGIYVAEAFATMTIFITQHTQVLDPLKYLMIAIIAVGAIWLTQIVLTAAWHGIAALAVYAYNLSLGVLRFTMGLVSIGAMIMEQGLWTTSVVLWEDGLAAWFAAAGTWALNAAIAFLPLIIVAAVIGLYLLYTRVGWFHHAVQLVWTWIKRYWPLVLIMLAGPVGLAVVLIIKHWDTVIGFITGLPGRMRSAGAHMWDWIVDMFHSIMHRIIGIWNETVGRLDLSFIGGPDLRIADPYGRRDTSTSRSGGPRASRTVGTTPTRHVSPDAATSPRMGMHTVPPIHTHVYLDQKEIAVAVTDYQTTQQGRR